LVTLNFGVAPGEDWDGGVSFRPWVPPLGDGGGGGGGGGGGADMIVKEAKRESRRAIFSN